MANISSAGVGSGLDVETIVAKLVSLERTPITQLETEKKKLDADLSAYGKVQSYMSTLRDAARKLTDATSWKAVTAASADASAVGVTAGSGAVASSYDVNVTRLASAQQLASSAYASSTAVVGEGSLTIELGTWTADQTGFTPKAGATAATITIDAGSTLEQVRDAINGAGAGVSASIVKDASGARLTLRSATTGAENGFRVSVADADANDTDAAGLSALAYDPMAGVNRMTRNQAAANAELTINGLAISSTTNTLTDVMDGLTLTLGKVTTAPVAVTVATDTATIKKNLTDFASAYNDVVKYLRDQTKYNEGNKSAGELQGDRSAVMMLSQLRSLAGASTGASSIFARLSSLGFDPQSDGSLKTNSTKLDAAMGNLAELRKAFANVDDAVPANRGLGVQMRQFVDGLLADDGALDNRQESLRASIARNDKRQDQLELRVTAFEKRVRAQYTALDASMGQMSGLSSYLSQQIAQFNKS